MIVVECGAACSFVVLLLLLSVYCVVSLPDVSLCGLMVFVVSLVVLFD
jgi:hypothetical protein